MKLTKNHLSIDIGGTKIRVIKYSKLFKVLKEKVYKTDNFFNKHKSSKLGLLFLQIKRDFNDYYDRLGISFNCAINKNHIFYSSLLGRKTSLNLEEICKKYFKFNLFLSDNDVVCMVKAENFFGYGKKYKNYVYVNLGTGIRTVAVENGNILRGYRNLAGEVAPLKIWVGELKKYIEADNLLAGKGLKNITYLLEKRGAEINESYFKNKSNNRIINLYLKYLSEFLLFLSYFYNPEIIIIGGSITKSSKYWLDKLKQKYYSNKNNLSFFLTKYILISQIKNPASLGAILI